MKSFSSSRNFRQRLAVNFLLLCITTAFLFLCLEFGLRKTHFLGARISWTTPDPVLGWRLTPNQNYWVFQENDHPITGRINHWGWKDKDWTLIKQNNVYRIAVLGDSFVEALQVESEANFLTLAEKELNRVLPAQRVELMNFGKSEVTQTEELLILEKDVLKFSPDMVILFFYPPNDIRDVRQKTAWFLRPFFLEGPDGSLVLDTSFTQQKAFKIKSWINPLKHHSILISFLIEQYNTYLMKNRRKKSLQEKQVGLSGYLSLATHNADPVYVQNYEWNKRLIREMSSLCKAKNIKLMLVTTDTPAFIPKIEKKYQELDPSFDPLFFEKDMHRFAESLKTDDLGLETIFEQAYVKNQKPLHWNHALEFTMPRTGAEEHAGHWNYEGHRLIAQALASQLSRRPGGKPLQDSKKGFE